MNEWALVTGAAVHLGRDMALTLAEMGYHIVLHYHHSTGEAEKTAADIRLKGVACCTCSWDLSKTATLDAFFTKVRSQADSKLTVLVNSASVFEAASLEATTAELHQHHLNVNLTAPFFLTQLFARQTEKGHVVNLTDAVTERNHSRFFSYLLTKKALTEFTKMAALELAPRIRVNAIAPGWVTDPPGSTDAYRQQLTRETPLRFKGNPGHISQALKFLLSHDYITGQIIYADGGRHLL